MVKWWSVYFLYRLVDEDIRLIECLSMGRWFSTVVLVSSFLVSSSTILGKFIQFYVFFTALLCRLELFPLLTMMFFKTFICHPINLSHCLDRLRCQSECSEYRSFVCLSVRLSIQVSVYATILRQTFCKSIPANPYIHIHFCMSLCLQKIGRRLFFEVFNHRENRQGVYVGGGIFFGIPFLMKLSKKEFSQILKSKKDIEVWFCYTWQSMMS